MSAIEVIVQVIFALMVVACIYCAVKAMTYMRWPK